MEVPLSCQVWFVNAVLRGGAEYCLSLKGNQDRSWSEVSHLFATMHRDQISEYADGEDLSHGRIESRIVSVIRSSLLSLQSAEFRISTSSNNVLFKMIKFSSINTPRKKHVVLLNLDQVIESKGGREKVFCDMANALVKKGYTVTAICCDPIKGKPSFPIDHKVRFINAYSKPKFYFLYKKPFKNLYCFSFSSIKRKNKRTAIDNKIKANSLKSVIHILYKADICIAFQPQSTYILKEYIKLNCPVVTMLHSVPTLYFERPDFQEYKSSLNNCATVQVLMPEYIKVTRKSLPNVPIIYIPNVAPQFNVTPDYSKKKIIVLARLSKEKRPLLLIQAMHLLSKKFPDWICEWWGEIFEESTFTKLIQSKIINLNLQDQFLLMGKTDNVKDKLKNASIFAIPSAFEGFSLSLGEALSMGLPAVGCADCPSVNTLIRNNHNGILTESNPNSYAKALERLMIDEPLRKFYGKNGKKDMQAFSPEIVWDQWDNLIQSLINK